jgi:outer membrane protein assembly factor BamB
MNKVILPGLIVVLLLSLEVRAAELPVPSPNYPTIQAAIDDANDGDTVVVADGRHTGYGNREIDFEGKAITVKSANGPENCIIDCNNTACGFRFRYEMEGPNSVIDGFTITNGSESRGGAINCSKSSPTIKNCIITDCSAESGGGIWCYASPQIINCVITSNYADLFGAGIFCSSIGSPMIVNCAVTNNSGRRSTGTAIFFEGPTSPTVINSTITQNTIGGIFCGEGDGSITITNSIVWGNADREISGYEPLNATVTHSNVRGGWEGIGNIDADPLLTPDGHLGAGSPCIDTADPTTDVTGRVDIDGEPRLTGARVDMGADEFLDTDSDGLPDWWEAKYFASATAANRGDDPDGDGYSNIAEYERYLSDPTLAAVTYYVDAENGDDSYDGRVPEWDGEHGPKRTIQAGIDAAIASDTVIVAPGRYVENIDYKGKAITVQSSEPGDRDVVENTIIDGSAGEPRVDGSCVLFDKGEGATSILEGVTLTRGTGGRAYYEDRDIGKAPVHAGGGILCVHSSPTIRRCIIRDNGMEDHGPAGGGVALLGSCQATISDCFIVHNREGSRNAHGCGMIMHSHSAETATSTIRNCTIAYNTTSEWQDWAYQVDCRETRPTISNTIIWNKRCEGPDCNHWHPPGRYTRSLLITDASLVTYSCVTNAYTYTEDYWYAEPCDITSFGGNIDESPGFVGAYIEDYPNEADYHLVANSACVNAGDPNFGIAPGAKDIDGQARVMGGRVDIGADEVVPHIVVTAPAAGDVWTSGSTHQVEWSGYGAGTVNILYSKDGGSNWQTIESGAADTGSYTWEMAKKMHSEQSVVSVVPGTPDSNVVCVDSGIFTIQPYRGPVSLPRGRGRKPKAGERYGPEFGCVKWTFETDGPVTAAVTLGRKQGQKIKAYVACEDGKLYTLDADTGALLWSYDTNSPLLGSAAEGSHGTVYFAATDGKLYALHRTGRLLWTHTTKRPVFSSPVVSGDGRIYVCSQDGKLYALAREGSELWRFETDGSGMVEGSIFATPAVGADGTVYIGGLYDPNLYALNRDDGSVKWVCNFEHTIQIIDDYGEGQDVNVAGWPFASPVVAFDGTVYQGLLFDSEIYAIEPTAGGISWSTSLAGLRLRYGKAPDDVVMWYDAGEPPEYVEVEGELRQVRSVTPIRHAYCWSTPALGPDGTIYVSFNDPYLRAVDPNGTVKWMTELGSMGGFTLSVGDDGLIYAASDDHYLYVVDPDGSEIARFEGDDWLSHPVIAEDHTIIVSDANNTVWAISQETCDGQEPVLDGAGEPESVETKRPVKIKKQPKNTANMRVKRL